MRLETIDSDDGFRSLGNEWDAVLSASRQDGPFLRHAWASAWWESFGDGSRLSVVLCRDDDDRLLGVLPTFSTRRGRILSARTGRFLADLGVGSTGLSAFALPEAEGEVFARLAEHVRGRAAGWDFLDLRFMDAGHGFLDAVASGGDVKVYHRRGVCPRAPLPPDWETYLGSLTKHMRHEVRRSMRRAAERGFAPELVLEPDALPGAVSDLLRLHEERMRAKLGVGFSVTAQAAAFTERAARSLLEEGRLRLMFLVQGGRRLAVLYMFRYGDTMYAVQSAFDEDDARQDVCRALWGHAIRAAIEEGCTLFDMLLGDQPYKFNWGATDVRHLAELHVYNRSLRAASRRAYDMVAEFECRRRRGTLQPVAATADPVRAAEEAASSETAS